MRPTYAQVISDWLGIPFEKIRLVQGDTDRVASGRGTFGARSMVCAGGALRNAADEIVAKGKRFAAQMLEAAEGDIEFADGMFKVVGTDRKVPLMAVARASHAPAGPLAKIGMGLEAVGTYDPIPSCPNGCHIAEVEIDCETGQIELVRYVAVDDVGVALNPMLVDGQVHGGVAQGVGQVLMEHVAYDPDSGQLLVGFVHGLLHAARRRSAVDRGRAAQRSGQDQSARREGRGRGGRRGRAARGHERDPRRVEAAGGLRHRDAGHAGTRVARHRRRAKRRRGMNKFGIGQPVSRKEDPRFLMGRGRFVDDISLPGQTYAFVLRSPHAHARIRSVRTEAAKSAPGVLLVLTGADADADQMGGLPPMVMPEDMGGSKGGYRTVQPILVRNRVRHVGDRVALVVAETLAQAKDAAELIEVEYDTLPSVTALDDATRDGAPLIWDDAPGNVCFTMEIGDKAKADAAIALAHHVERIAVVNNRIASNPMEARAVLATHDPVIRRTSVWATSQAPHRLKQFVAAEVLKIPINELAVVAPDVGGGFGTKGQLYPEDSLVCWAARKLARPVKWIGERSECIATDAAGRDQLDEAEMAFDAEGHILAFRCRVDANMGAYISTAGSASPVSTLRMLTSVYRFPVIHAALRGVFTNTGPVGNYRGAGRPEATYMLERLLDGAAKKLGLDTVEIRRRNLIAPSAMPYQTHVDLVYDVGEFETVMDKTLALFDRKGFTERRAASERNGKLRGWGISPFLEFAAQFNERMGLRIEPDGSAVVLAGTHSHGQGHETVYAQLVSDWLGVPFEQVRLIQGDTERITYGRGTFASRSMTVGGTALRDAADQIVDKGRKIAAHILEAAEADVEFSDGVFRIAGTDRQVPLATVARAAHERAVGPLAKLGFVGLDGEATNFPAFNFPNGCHICEVEVDPETGAVSLERFIAVDDVGVALNPLLVDGQVHGGIAQGVGQALWENVAFERESGQLLSGSFMDYCMPRADDLPSFEVALHEVPTKTNPLGVKGAGEAGCVGAPAAAINAILDALTPYGVTDIAMPATAERVWRAIQQANR